MKLKNPQGGGGGGLALTRIKSNQVLVGALDGINKDFTTPHKFVLDIAAGVEPIFKRNGQTIYLGKEIERLYESGGVGTGYDAAEFKKAPKIEDVLTADYISLI